MVDNIAFLLSACRSDASGSYSGLNAVLMFVDSTPTLAYRVSYVTTNEAVAVEENSKNHFKWILRLDTASSLHLKCQEPSSVEDNATIVGGMESKWY